VNGVLKSTGVWLALLVILGVVAVASAAEAKKKPKTTDEAKQLYSDGNKVVKLADQLSLSAVVGKSPWLIMAAGGITKYYRTASEERGQLGFLSSPLFFIPVGIVVMLVALKDTLLSWAAWLKVPLNALAELFHMSGGIFGYLYLGSVAFDGTIPDTETASLVFAATTEKAVPVSDMALSTISFMLMSIVHTAVWIVFNGVEVAIILSPFPFVDAVLKTGRTALIGVITSLAAIHPILGFVAAAPIIILCLLCIPVAIRITVVGWVYSWDILARIIGRSREVGLTVSAFASANLKAPMLAYGTLSRNQDGKLIFSYRKLSLLWRIHEELPAPAQLGIGTLNPYLLSTNTEGKQSLLLRLPPGYANHETELAQVLGLASPVDVSTLTSLKQALSSFWNWVRGR